MPPSISGVRYGVALLGVPCGFYVVYDPRVKSSLACFLFLPVSLLAQANESGVAAVKAEYTKYEYRIAMCDGKKLFTSVYSPKD